jgi:acyl-CoA thioester hydrolase
MQDLLKDYPVIIETPIAWGDMDAFQHVNNVRYFRFFESARIAYFEKLAFMQVMDDTGVGPILASTQCRFRIPLAYPDSISVGARISEIGADRFTMQYRVVSHRHRQVAAEGEGLVIAFDYRNKCKHPLPKVLRQRIAALEGLSGEVAP